MQNWRLRRLDHPPKRKWQTSMSVRLCLRMHAGLSRMSWWMTLNLSVMQNKMQEASLQSLSSLEHSQHVVEAGVEAEVGDGLHSIGLHQ